MKIDYFDIFNLVSVELLRIELSKSDNIIKDNVDARRKVEYLLECEQTVLEVLEDKLLKEQGKVDFHVKYKQALESEIETLKKDAHGHSRYIDDLKQSVKNLQEQNGLDTLGIVKKDKLVKDLKAEIMRLDVAATLKENSLYELKVDIKKSANGLIDILDI